MTDFKIEKNIPMIKVWTLGENTKNLIEQLDIGESFNFPMQHYLPIKRLIERTKKKQVKRFSLRRVAFDKGRIWRVV